MSGRFAKIRSKIERAKYHIDQFEAAQTRFLKTNPYRLVINDNPQILERIYRVEQVSGPPIELSLIAGDAIHNMRSALDHVACQLVEANGNIITRRTAFPIHQVRPGNEIRNSTVIQGIHSSAIDIIEAAQPYETGSDDLWKLHQLDIADKHYLLLVVGYLKSSATVRLSADGSPGSASFGFTMPFLGPIPDDGAELGRITGMPNLPNMHQKFDFSVEIAFTESQVTEGDVVLRLLKKLANVVDALASQFIPFL